MKKLTIVIPVYNAEAYIKRCLDSVVENEAFVEELILIDDGSSDNGAEICKAYAQKYSYIKYFYQQNSGPSAARNKGLTLASGEYIMFLDSDDYIEDLSEVHRVLGQYNSDYYIFPNLEKINRENSPKTNIKEDKYKVSQSQEIIRLLIKEEKINSPCSKVYKREIIKEHNISFNSQYNMAEDLLFNMEYLNCCDNFVVNCTPFYYYCFVNSESLTQRYIENKYDMLMAVNQRLKEIFGNLSVDDMYDFLVYKNTFSSIKDFSHSGCKLSLREKLLKIKEYKKQTAKRIITNCGLKMLVWSLIFCIFPRGIIYLFTKIGG